MLTSLSTEDLIPKDHPIRRVRKVVDEVLVEMDGEFDAMYSRVGRPSVPPEQLLKATILMALYSVRSERAFCERLNYDLLFKWFLDLPIDARAFDPTTFTKNRDRLLQAEVADRFFAAVVRQARLRRYVSSEHFSVDGTLLEAWASHKSFKPKDGPGPAQCRGRLPRPHAQQPDPPVGHRPRSVVGPQGQHRSEALLHGAPTDGEPQRPAHRRGADPGRRLRRAGHRARHAGPLAPPGPATDRRRRQGLRHPSLRRRLPRPGRHPPRRPEHDEAALGHRPAHHPPPRARGQPTGPAPDRGTLRLDQDHRRRPKAPLPGARTEPGLVPAHRRHLQPAPDHRPRHQHHIGADTQAPSPTP